MLPPRANPSLRGIHAERLPKGRLPPRSRLWEWSTNLHPCFSSTGLRDARERPRFFGHESDIAKHRRSSSSSFRRGNEAVVSEEIGHSEQQVDQSYARMIARMAGADKKSPVARAFLS